MNVVLRRLVLSNSILGLLVLVMVGCEGGLKTAPVAGTVSLDGKPLEKIMVEFWPESEGTRSFATTDDQGHYVLQTDDGEKKGATIGTHKVVLRDLSVYQDKFLGRGDEEVSLSNGKKSRISNAYTLPTTTPMTKTVEAGKENVIEIEVEKAK